MQKFKLNTGEVSVIQYDGMNYPEIRDRIPSKYSITVYSSIIYLDSNDSTYMLYKGEWIIFLENDIIVMTSIDFNKLFEEIVPTERTENVTKLPASEE